MDLRQQQSQAAERYRRTADEREATAHRQEAEHSRVVDSSEQVEARAQHLLRVGQLTPATLLAAMPQAESLARHGLLERIIAATNDLQSVSFLPRGERAARTVARISALAAGRRVPFGTGFLVAPRLLMTNNHVLPDVATVAGSVAEFDCEVDRDDVPKVTVGYGFDPGTLFLTDEHLDVTLVALRRGPDGRWPGDEFGWNRLIAQQGKIVIGEPVNIAGHPNGRLKEIAIRNNGLVNQLDHFLHYTTDTEPGNSGSPVYNDQWEVVALHHSGVPRTDGDGNWLKTDGTRWRPQDGDAAVDWVANEGARVSVLLAHLAALDLPAAQRDVLAELESPVRPGDAGAGATTGVGDLPAAPPPTDGPPGGPGGPAGESRASKTGIPALRPPHGGQRHLVFLHGRQQQGRDPVVLRAAWAGGLARGLAAGGYPPVDAAHVWFPFYGDAFAAALDRRERHRVESVGWGHDLSTAAAFAPDTPSTRSLYEALISEAAERAGMTAQVSPATLPPTEEGILTTLVGALQPQLSWLANRSRLDDAFIAMVFRDVAAYLDREAVRNVVLDSVLETIPRSGEVVLVSHSLGTVVALDLMTRLPPEVHVTLLVTAGSPLGMDSIHRRLLGGGPRRPERVGEWVNAWCAADAIAIGCPLRTTWGDRVTEVRTDNHQDRAHDIEEYLADSRVARSIGEHLTR